ncbi:unnamed protein product [Arabidopsis halleri]
MSDIKDFKILRLYLRIFADIRIFNEYPDTGYPEFSDADMDIN